MKKHLLAILLILLILLAAIPLFKPYVSGTADGLGHRFRLVSFYNALEEGILKPRWAKEAALSYGAPTFLFNYPLPYYLASFFLKLGFSVNQAGQLLSFFSLFFSGLFMYLATGKLAGKLAGLVAAVVYIYAPYHLQMTYLYDAWGETLAFVFPPLLLYLSFCLIGQIRQIRYLVILTLSWVLFILSHNVSAIMFSPALLILGFLATDFKIKKFLLVVNAFFLAVWISSFFWLPAWSMQNYMKYPQFLSSEAAMRGAFFKPLSFQLATAFRVIREGVTHYLDFTVGLPIMLTGFLSLGYFIRHFLWRLSAASPASKSKVNKNIGLLDDCLPAGEAGVIGLFLLLLSSLYLINHASSWLWRFPPLTYVLYPFRFLFVASFLGALLAGVFVRKSWFWALILIVLAIFQGRPYLAPYVDIFPFPDSYFYQRQTVSTVPFTKKNMLIKEFLPKKASESFLQGEENKYLKAYFAKEVVPIKEITVVEGEGEVGKVESFVEETTAEVTAKTPVKIAFHRFFFPNWSVFVDGRQFPLAADEVGRINLSLPPGSYNLRLIFGRSAVEKIAWSVSTLGAVLFIVEMVYINKKCLGHKRQFQREK